MAEFPKPIRNLMAILERLPGVGPKSASRLVFYLLSTPNEFLKRFSDALIELGSKIRTCRECFGVSENEVCDICSDEGRDRDLICVVEKAIDMMAIENIGGFKGVYHVLGGVINPLDHVGPEDLRIGELITKLKNKKDLTKVEVVLATNPTMEGEATALYIKREIEQMGMQLKLSRIGSGLPVGADLEYADESTLNRAMEGRKEYK